MGGKYGSPAAKVEFDSTPGGSLIDVTAHVLTLGGLKIEQITEENSPFGQAYESTMPVGKQRMPDIPVTGNWDSTAATGSHAVFGTPDTDPNGAARTLKVTVGDGKYFLVETHLVDYEVQITDGKLTGYKATIRQAGLASWN